MGLMNYYQQIQERNQTSVAQLGYEITVLACYAILGLMSTVPRGALQLPFLSLQCSHPQEGPLANPALLIMESMSSPSCQSHSQSLSIITEISEEKRPEKTCVCFLIDVIDLLLASSIS